MSPIFIVGMQRSGTTLMRAVLSAHPRIAIAPETHYCDYFMKNLGNHQPFDEPAFRAFWANFAGSGRFKDLGIDAATVEGRIYENGDLSLREIFRCTLEEFARRKGAQRWGEKTPHHYKYMQLLLSWFPNAQIIVMVRDPRAVCSSLLKVPWRRPKRRGIRRLELRQLTRARRTYTDALEWQEHVNDLRGIWSLHDQVKVVLYEDLVNRPEAILTDVCNFLGETFEEAMLIQRKWETVAVGGHTSCDDVRNNWERNHLVNTLAPINRGSIDKWKKDLNAWEIIAIERACRSGMNWFNYRECQRILSRKDEFRGNLYLGWSSLLYKVLHSRRTKEFLFRHTEYIHDVIWPEPAKQ